MLAFFALLLVTTLCGSFGSAIIIRVIAKHKLSVLLLSSLAILSLVVVPFISDGDFWGNLSEVLRPDYAPNGCFYGILITGLLELAVFVLAIVDILKR